MEQQSESPLPPNQNNHIQSTQKLIPSLPKQKLENSQSHCSCLDTKQRLLKIEKGNKEEQLRLEAQNQSPENREKDEWLPLEDENNFIELHKLNDRCKVAQGLDSKQKNLEIKKILESLAKLLKIEQAIKEKLQADKEKQYAFMEEYLRRAVQNSSLEKEGKEGCLIESENNRVSQEKQKPAEELYLSNNQQGYLNSICFNETLADYQFYLKMIALRKLKEYKQEAEQAFTRVKEARLARSLIEKKFFLALDIDQKFRETQYYIMAVDISCELVKICFDQHMQCSTKLDQESEKIAQMVGKVKIS